MGSIYMEVKLFPLYGCMGFLGVGVGQEGLSTWMYVIRNKTFHDISTVSP